jgi:hypothetical protein
MRGLSLTMDARCTVAFPCRGASPRLVGTVAVCDRGVRASTSVPPYTEGGGLRDVERERLTHARMERTLI